jgi:hypothetical protein
VAGAAVSRACAAKLQVLESIILFAAFARTSLSYDQLGQVAENVLSRLEACSLRAASRNVFRVIDSENGIISWQLMATRKEFELAGSACKNAANSRSEEKFEAFSGTDDDVNLSAGAGGMLGPLHRKR